MADRRLKVHLVIAVGQANHGPSLMSARPAAANHKSNQTSTIPAHALFPFDQYTTLSDSPNTQHRAAKKALGTEMPCLFRNELG